MPYIRVQVSGSPDSTLAQSIAKNATALTARMLGKDPNLTAVVVDFIDARHWFIAGGAVVATTARSYHWMVSITDETNTRQEKAAYLKAVHAAMGSLLGEVAEHSYVHIADLRASAYGYGGETQERRYQYPSQNQN